MKKVTVLLVGALVALLSLAPVAGAKGKHHRTVSVCGIIDRTSELPGTLVLATGGTRLVTIQNTTPVVLTADIAAGADVCAKATLVRTTPAATAKARHGSGVARTKVLVSVQVRPAAWVAARGAVTLGAGQITVATLVFTFPEGFVLSPKVTEGKIITAIGSAATAGGPIVLKKVKRSHRGRSHGHGSAIASAKIAGRVSGLTAATATDPGSITVGGITLVIPAGTVLRSEVTDGAFVAAKAVVTAGVLTLKKVKVLSVAVTTAPAV